MAVIAHIVLPGVSREQYDAVRAAVIWLKQPPDGGLAHVAWWEGFDNHNIGAWDSEQDVQAFAEQRLMPAMVELGINVEPLITFHAAHEVFAPQAVTVTAT